MSKRVVLRAENYLHLVDSVLRGMMKKKKWYKIDEVRYEDLYSAGCLGLVQGCKKYRGDGKINPEAYLSMMIRYRMIDEWRVLYGRQYKINKWRSSMQLLAAIMGKKGIDDVDWDLYPELVPPEILRDVMNDSGNVDSDSFAFEDEKWNGFDEVDNRDLVKDLMEYLYPLEAKIIRMKILEGRSINYICSRVKLRRSTVYRIFREALYKMGKTLL